MINYLREKKMDDFDLFDGLRDLFFSNLFFDNNGVSKNIMKTDIIETNDEFKFVVELPGVCKEDVKMELDDGNLIISYEKKENEDNKYILHERYYNSGYRSYYVGKEYKEEDINAKFEDGILEVTLPKEVKTEPKKYINII